MAAPAEHVGPAETPDHTLDSTETPDHTLDPTETPDHTLDPTETPDHTLDPTETGPPTHDPDCGASEDDGDEEDAGPAQPRVRDTPEDIRLEAVANTVCFHPSRELLATGDVDGDIYVFSYSCTEGEGRELWSSGHHLKSCRQLSFSQDGRHLLSVSKDRSLHLMDVENGRLLSRIRRAHGAPINALLVVDQNLAATGDDGGTLKVWDLRKNSAIMDLKHHADYISDITVDQNKRTLLTTSGDGTLGVFNIKRRRFELLSESQSGDLTSVAIMKRGRKVACGSSEGTVYIFNWNGLGATSDRFALRAESVDCMVPITDSLLCAASTDGYIRAVSILPSRVVGCVGQHVGEAVESMSRSWDGRFLASSAHDQLVKFWDVSALASLQVDTHRKRKRKGGRLQALSKKAHGEDDFFSGLAEEAQEAQEEEEEEEEEEESDSDSGSD